MILNTFKNQIDKFTSELRTSGVKIKVCNDKDGTIIHLKITDEKLQRFFSRKSWPYFFPLFSVEPEFYTEQSKSKQEALKGTMFEYTKRDLLKNIDQYQPKN